ERVQADLLRLLADPAGAELLGGDGVHGVDRVDVGVEEAGGGGPLRAAGLVERVGDALAVLRAVTGVGEARGRGEDLVVERRRSRDRLEGRTRWIEPLRRAVQERRRRPAGCLR